jgi:hypothetical protein
MYKRLLIVAVAVLALGCLAWAGSQTWTGTVSDSHCGLKHAEPSAAATQCVTACVKGGAKYVLVSDGKVYQLDDQAKFADYAGKSVKVTGELKGDTITVESVSGGM